MIVINVPLSHGSTVLFLWVKTQNLELNSMSVDSDQIINIQFSTGIHIWKKFKSVIVEGRLPWHLALSYHLSIWKEDKVLSERDLLHPGQLHIPKFGVICFYKNLVVMGN